MRLLHLLNILF